MAKPIVFISHIYPEKTIAIAFKELIEKHFLGMMEVFVASDGASITMGDKWLDEITEHLQRCAVEIIFCSPISVERRWINFEAGAGWVRKIPVIPICHSGITPATLPMPLTMLQGANATDADGLERVFARLATALSSKAPNVDFAEFVSAVTAFEQEYAF